MKIALVEPSGLAWRKREPLGLEYLGSFAATLGHEIRLFHPALQQSELNRQLESFGPDVLAMSVMTCNLKAAKEVARNAKLQKHPPIIVVGGSHPTGDPEVILDGIFDYAIAGEGELAFAGLTEVIEAKRSVESVPGLIYISGGQLVMNRSKRTEFPDTLPPPIRSAEIIRDCSDGGLNFPDITDQVGHASVVYGRGCNQACTFCIASKMWQGRAIYRSAKSVVAEMKELQDRFGSNFIFLVDLTFNADKNKTLALRDAMAESGVKISWRTEGRVELADERALGAMVDSGCTKMCYGVETFDPEALKKIRKNQTVAQTIRAFELTNKVGMLSRASYIIGFPWDTEDSLASSERGLIDTLPADELRICFATPFPGTTLFTQASSNSWITTDDTDRFTSDEPVMATALSNEELFAWKERILSSYYKSHNYQSRIASKIRKFPHLRKSFEAFLDRVRR